MDPVGALNAFVDAVREVIEEIIRVISSLGG